MGKTTGASLLLSLAAVCLLCAAPQGPAWGMRLRGSVEAARLSPLALKAQASGGLGPYLETSLLPWLGVGVGLEADAVLPSDLSGGYQYRGHGGVGLRPYLALRGPLRPRASSVEPMVGVLVGPVARYDGYFLTYRSFFYLGAAAEPLLELYFRKSVRHSLLVSLPLELYFRKDLSVSASAGLAVAWKMYLRPVGTR